MIQIDYSNTNVCIDNLIVELTRKCNMSCQHCLRGAAENKQISIETLDNIFSKIYSINMLTLGGGENSLSPKNIENLIDSLQKNGVDVQNFYVVTNAKKLTPSFFNAIERLFNYCNDNECSQLVWSNDKFHEEIDYRNFAKLEDFKDLLMCKYNANDYIVSTKWSKGYELNYNGLLAIGNAVDLGGKSIKIYPFEIELFDDSVNVRDGEIYVSYNGNVFPSCNLSYNIMDNCSLYKTGNVNDNDFNFISFAETWNKKINECLEINEYELINDNLL